MQVEGMKSYKELISTTLKIAKITTNETMYPLKRRSRSRLHGRLHLAKLLRRYFEDGEKRQSRF